MSSDDTATARWPAPGPAPRRLGGLAGPGGGSSGAGRVHHGYASRSRQRHASGGVDAVLEHPVRHCGRAGEPQHRQRGLAVDLRPEHDRGYRAAVRAGQASAIAADIARLRAAQLRIVPSIANVTGGNWDYQAIARILHNPALCASMWRRSWRWCSGRITPGSTSTMRSCKLATGMPSPGSSPNWPGRCTHTARSSLWRSPADGCASERRFERRAGLRRARARRRPDPHHGLQRPRQTPRRERLLHRLGAVRLQCPSQSPRKSARTRARPPTPTQLHPPPPDTPTTYQAPTSTHHPHPTQPPPLEVRT